MHNRIIIHLILGTMALVVGCSPVQVSEESKNKDLIKPEQPRAVPEHPDSYVRVMTPEQRLPKKTVSINSKEIALMDAVKTVLPQLNVIAKDNGVNLRTLISVYANDQKVDSYLEQLEGLSGYNFELKGNDLYVSSFVTNKWIVPSLSRNANSTAKVGQQVAQGAGGGGGGGGGAGGGASQTSVTMENSSDSWAEIKQAAENILGITDQQQQQQQTTDSAGAQGDVQVQTQAVAELEDVKPWVSGVRRLGMIQAAGPPNRMEILDQWMTQMQKTSNRQVHLDVKVLDVTLDDEVQRGIDWSALYDSEDVEIDIGRESTLANTAEGVWSIASTVGFGKFSFNNLFQFLREYGEVSVLNEPNTTVTNGHTAYLSSGDEFSYIASVEQSQDINGNPTVTPVLERVKVGVTLAVTPRLLDDGRVLMDVVPVISSVQDFREFSVSGFTFETPNIALQELSTQVIAESGETIQLGGLIQRQLTDAMTGIPFEGKGSDNQVFEFFFENGSQELSRRELVIAITPQMVSSS